MENTLDQGEEINLLSDGSGDDHSSHKELAEEQDGISMVNDDETESVVKTLKYSGPLEPCKDMIFDELEDAMICYKAYARQKGFSIRKSHTTLSRSDKSLIGVEYACSREGRRYGSLKKQNIAKLAETRIGCKAMMGLKREKEKWVVSKFVIEHNHELCSPKSTLLLRGHRKITHAQKNLINVLNEAGVPTRKIMSVLTHESGGDNVGCAIIDVQNYLGSKRRNLLKEGDAQRMADARSRLAYQYFGDVVTFDSTYLTNRYSMPFVPFTGVNHHHQSMMFGCALLVNETTNSYVWLLKTWLEAMLGRAPKVIITDDDKAMGAAISIVLPNTTHRLCMWHILQKVPEHLAHVYNKYPSFQGDFHRCIHDTITTGEFENAWMKLLQNYELGENDWLKDIYMRREKWVPAYLRTKFCAGMSTTQRSESMNKLFKGFVRSSTLVSDFVYQYEKALDARYQKEKEKDVKTKNSKPVLKTCYGIEAEAAKVYTRKLFLMFQDELFSSQKYNASKYNEMGKSKSYVVMPNGKERPSYEVSFNISEKKASCSCQMFEFVGILCRHILAVFVKKSLVSSLPQHYILERWTINANSRVIQEISNIEVEYHQSSEIMRNSLMVEFLKVLEEGQKSQEKYNHLVAVLQKVYGELLAFDDENGGTGKEDSSRNTTNMQFTLLDPPRVASKGRPKSLRQKKAIEIKRGKKRKCSTCKETGHTRSNCPLKNQSRGKPSSDEKNESKKDENCTKSDPSQREVTMKNTSSKKQKITISLQDETDEQFFNFVLESFDLKIKELVIERLENVVGDGHCGYRCCAELLGLSSDNGWMIIRKSMLLELKQHRELYMGILGGEKNYHEVEVALNYFEVFGCERMYWMQFPSMGCLFATAFNCVLSVLSPRQYTTYLPLRLRPDIEIKTVQMVLYKDNHFLKFYWKDGAPIPPITPGWHNIRYPDASLWEDVIIERIYEWEKLIGYPFIEAPSIQNDFYVLDI